MDPTLLFAVISPMAVLATVSVVAFYYLSGMKQVNDYERELKELRHQVIQGKLGHKTFR